MKHPTQREETAKFNGSLRHYHRTSSQKQRTWDEWVDGRSASKSHSFKWLKIVGISVAVLALCVIVVGLVIELR